MCIIKYFFIILNLYFFNLSKKLNKCPILNAKEYIYVYRTWLNFKVIYKVIINEYDGDLYPKFLNYDYDYIFYTNNLDIYLFNNNSIWQYYKIPEKITNLKLNPTKQNRYLKINAYKYLPNQYNFSIYIDGNVIIINDINLLLNQLKKKYKNINFFVPIHPDRDCIYDEAKAVLKYKKDISKNINPQIKIIKDDGFPKHYGLSENNILIRNHKDPNIIKFMKQWWKMIKKGSKRDQLSFIYISWKYNFTNFAFIERKLIKYYFKIIRDHNYTHFRVVIKEKDNYFNIFKIMKKVLRKFWRITRMKTRN